MLELCIARELSYKETFDQTAYSTAVGARGGPGIPCRRMKMNSRVASTRSSRKRQAKIRSQLAESVSDRKYIIISSFLRNFLLEFYTTRKSYMHIL